MSPRELGLMIRIFVICIHVLRLCGAGKLCPFILRREITGTFRRLSRSPHNASCSSGQRRFPDPKCRVYSDTRSARIAVVQNAGMCQSLAADRRVIEGPERSVVSFRIPEENISKEIFTHLPYFYGLFPWI